MADEPKVLSFDEYLATPEGQKAFQTKLDAEVGGLKNKNSELIDKNKKIAEQIKNFEGLDVDKLKTLQKQLNENEEMRLLSEGKTEEVVTRRTENMKRDFDAQLAARDGKLTEYQTILKQKQDKLEELVIDGQIRESYLTLDFEPTALDDVLRLGRTVFIMGDDGNAAPRDASGNLIFGKDGKTPISAAEWLVLQAEKKPYLRKASAGAGGQGSGKGGKNVDKSTMTPAQRIAHGLRQGKLA